MRIRIIAAALVSSLWLLAAGRVFGQGTETPIVANSAPSAEGSAVTPVKPVVTTRMALPEHKFFDVKNSLAMASVAASLAGDGWSTQRALALAGSREVNPIARAFVDSRAGEVAYSSGSFALVAGGMYLAHKTNHHKLERIAPFVLAGWEAFLTAWNLHQVTRANH